MCALDQSDYLDTRLTPLYLAIIVMINNLRYTLDDIIQHQKGSANVGCSDPHHCPCLWNYWGFQYPGDVVDTYEEPLNVSSHYHNIRDLNYVL